MTKLNKILDELHVRLGEELLEKIKSGKARASDLNVCRQFLKDNGVESIAIDNSPLKSLVDELPFTDPEDDKPRPPSTLA